MNNLPEVWLEWSERHMEFNKFPLDPHCSPVKFVSISAVATLSWLESSKSIGGDNEFSKRGTSGVLRSDERLFDGIFLFLEPA